MSKESERVKQYKHDLKLALLLYFGDRCQKCNNGNESELEFAHIKQSGAGRGRGSYKRLIEVKNNPENFNLFCDECHKEYDRGKI